MEFTEPELQFLNIPEGPENAAERAAQAWIDREDMIPKDINYNWLPLCTALVEPFLGEDQSGNNNGNVNLNNGTVNPLDIMNNLPPDFLSAPSPSSGHSDEPSIERVPDRQLPNKDPAKGAWDHVVYLPAWTDPDFKSTSYVEESGKKFKNTVKDALHDLRPALRLEDQVRNPTQYARRFGIAADRLDGRSRMSPTWDTSRDAMVDFRNQVDALSKESREEAERRSREIYSRSGKKPPPGQEVLPIVMAELLEKHGVVDNVELMTILRHNSGTKFNLEEVIEELNRQNPNHKKAHMTFFDMLQQDQDYQRLLLTEMTTDEAIQRGIHSVTDDTLDSDLDNPILPLFARQRWESSDWKGGVRKTPKYAYSINGNRELWDVTTNDKLWNALQPALRLASKVFLTKHPYFEALMDMRCRQMVDMTRDPRVNPPTIALHKFVYHEDIDMNLTWPQIRTLHEVHDYNWKENVLNFLRAFLRIDIGSAYSHVGFADPDSAGPRPNTFHYGATHTTAGDTTAIVHMKLSAEIIWPLLVDGYTKSEKLACSYIIANTILHELAHCIVQAQNLLTSGMTYVRPQGQSDEVAALLLSLGADMWDFSISHAEPFFQDMGHCEVGSCMENEVWGYNVSSLLEQSLARYYQGLPLIVGTNSWPNGSDDAHLKNTVIPSPEIYNRPLPIAHIARYFTKNWWEEEYARYGHAAFKKTPDAYPLLSLMRTRAYDHKTGFATFGDAGWRFLAAVPRILRTGRHAILSEYLVALITEALGRNQILHRWAEDVKRWKDEVIDPLEEAWDLLHDEFTEAMRLISEWQGSDDMRYQAYVNYNNENPLYPLTRAEWDAKTEEDFVQEFRDGGWIMRRLVTLHERMQLDITVLERMVFDFLTVDPHRRSFLYAGQVQGASTPLGIAMARMLLSIQYCENMASTLATVIAVPALFQVKDQFDAWRARFQANRTTYMRLAECIDKNYEIHPASQEWKTKFPRIPSAYWKLGSQRLEKLAFREYSRAVPAVRTIVDEVLGKLNSYHGMALEIQGPASVEQIEKTLRTMPGWDPVAGEITNKRRGLFDFSGWTKAPPGPVPVPELPMSGDLARPSSSSSAGSGGIIFGKAGGPSRLGGTPPRRASGREAFTKYGLGENALRRVAGGRIATPRSQSRTALGGASSTALNAANLPDVIRSQQGRMGGPQPRQVAPDMILPFPNAYANRTTLTSELEAHAKGSAKIDEIVDEFVQKDQFERGVYQAPGIFREPKKTDSPSP
ncbi:hypothetical protein F5Y18DRAFT_425467 [Xylariaceae sp. FL1019]|nr:hypothetical protein F5Y18DRAFT_425467 [Xylariaceae sp. FL1019]